jgi:predicted alpha/beta superfamily hydrolase
MRLAHWILAASLMIWAVAPGEARAGVQEGPTGTPIVIGASYSLESEALGEARQINVWVPAAHGSDQRRYKTLYVLDGGLSQDFQHIAGLAQLGDLSWTFEPLIVVGVETRDRRSDLTQPPLDPRFSTAFPTAGGADAFRRFLAEEVIPFVEARHQTSDHRGLAGESLAGLFVVDTLLNTPHLFADYFAISPSLWWDDQRLSREAEARLRQADFAGRRLWLAMADEGGTMQQGVDRLRRSVATASNGPALTYADRSATDTHATIYHGAMLEALRAFYATPWEEEAQSPWYMIPDGVPPPPEN